MYRLATRDGSHVQDVQVGELASNPDVLMWGDRVFIFHASIQTGGDPATAEYREANVFRVPIPLNQRENSPAFTAVTDPHHPTPAAAAPAPADHAAAAAAGHGFDKVTEPQKK